MIRKAKPYDKKEIAELCYIIWSQLDIDMVKEVEKSRLLNIMKQSMVDVKYRGHISNVWVYEIDGHITGCLIAYPGDQELELEQAWLELNVDEDIKAYGTPMPMKEANDDEWYIETVATFPQYRGNGVATKLIKHVLDNNPNEKWSLNCDVENIAALHVYEKLGFQIMSEFDLYGHMHYHLVYTQS
ncbi:GNAT family N-acetyltransferase [Staphylococcus nepalensis]|uniref:GNAT family N-acetyltransferase n=1 Tax=Staphylococcus nepalensis TaxID=214473 RepID=UPI000E058F1E|nr:GNAT family N-acetyltransferase [Staphylococcus nepalensis]SUM70198.1 acetyltransferase (GNAT) family protein [Staphylococcus nepalensis]SUM96209.1 acetyltransferase (GNAT) family protein [Staphylococcus nepalensis]